MIGGMRKGKDTGGSQTMYIYKNNLREYQTVITFLSVNLITCKLSYLTLIVSVHYQEYCLGLAIHFHHLDFGNRAVLIYCCFCIS
jgi:hypothetical protein